ncbi:CBS domain-containing protein [Rhodococcus olei]|uniref:CBS domain-containing protein n=1 Tax=Rhodococcus olei TaxID=2161675 RepID=A0ABP8PNV1_9NOCA
MRIADVLRGKGPAVVTVDPGTSVEALIGELTRRNLGALVVMQGNAMVGIVTERDVVHQIHERGPGVLSATVGEIMTVAVFTCAPGDTVDSLAATMTERRIRHLPVLEDGRLVGIVSIGDVVKSRIDELQSERDQLEAYIDRR